MRLEQIFRKMAPVAALAAATALSGCGINSVDGVPLAELDTSGPAPSGVALGGSDLVVITSGDTFTIDIEGSEEAQEAMRFDLDEDTLSIGRESDDGGQATVNITMPAPTSLAVGGSGQITTDAMSGDPEIAIGGSGQIIATGLDGGRLEVALGGSGRTEISGEVDNLELAIGGSGTADMADLQVGDAEISVGGSGNATFASDGNVEARIAGSGDIRVTGSATCTLNSVGSGRLICEEAPAEPEDDDGDTAEE